MAALNKELLQIMANPEVREKFARDGFDPVGSSAGEFSQFIRAEVVKWGKVIKTRRLVME